MVEGTLEQALKALCDTRFAWSINNNTLQVNSAKTSKTYYVPISATNEEIWKEILSTTGKHFPEGGYSVNKQSGIILAIGSETQHEQMQKYVTALIENVSAQVCISVTVIHVKYSEAFSGGVDLESIWQMLARKTQAALSGQDIIFKTSTDQSDLKAICEVFGEYGEVSNTSTTFVSATNNYTAELKVGKQLIYFNPTKTDSVNKKNPTLYTTNGS